MPQMHTWSCAARRDNNGKIELHELILFSSGVRKFAKPKSVKKPRSRISVIMGIGEDEEGGTKRGRSGGRRTRGASAIS